jgi:hypothetical protein
VLGSRSWLHEFEVVTHRLRFKNDGTEIRQLSENKKDNRAENYSAGEPD